MLYELLTGTTPFDKDHPNQPASTKCAAEVHGKRRKQIANLERRQPQSAQAELDYALLGILGELNALLPGKKPK